MATAILIIHPIARLFDHVDEKIIDIRQEAFAISKPKYTNQDDDEATMSDLRTALNYPADRVKQYIDAGHWTDEMLHEWVAVWARKTPDAAAAICPAGTLKYDELYDGARRLASGLLGLGFKKGDVIGFQLPNVPEFLTVFLGTQMIGVVPCMMHMPYRSGELEPMLRHGRAKGVICFGSMQGYDAAATMLGIKSSLPALKSIIVVGGDAPDGTVPYERLLAADYVDISDPPSADDPAVITFTSGTSASPKAVVHSNRTLSSSARACVLDMGIGNKDVVLCAPAHTHAFGLCVAIITLCAGAACAMMPVFTPPALAETIKATKTTVLCCGPAHVLACNAAGLWTPEVTETLKRVFIGGAVCPPRAVQIIDDACSDGKAYQMWGMTEVLMGIVPPLDAPLDLRLKSLGTPPAGHEVRIVAGDGAVLGSGEEGELQMRGPFLFAGYYENEAANKDAFSEDGWFRTGDLATIDDDQNISVSGRLKDLIIRGGIKINPVDIEILIDAHPSVMQSAIIPVPDEVLGERACLVLVPLPGQKAPTLRQIQEYLASNKVTKIRWPERVEVVDAMPITATRKIIKSALAKQIA